MILIIYFFVLRGRDFDKRQWESTDVYEKYNVPDTYRNKSELARSIQSEKRAGKFIENLVIYYYSVMFVIF
jgi:hypothetical protein